MEVGLFSNELYNSPPSVSYEGILIKVVFFRKKKGTSSEKINSLGHQIQMVKKT